MIDLGSLSFAIQHGHGIVPVFHLVQSENASIYTCRSDDLALLSPVDVGNDGSEIVGVSGLDLNEDERLAIECDKIDLSGHLHSLAVSSNRHLEIRSDKAIAKTLEKSGGKHFSEFAKTQGLQGISQIEEGQVVVH